ncbi:rhodanese-like domain-containing protein [Craterilacuibacter sp.]|uniref:rhodanese-like domain-containing protein n=1 Tax=Craterilacuibacter sp. TaxID=2870909 RepID=UPI003F408002
MISEIRVAELAVWLADTQRQAPFLLDVREPWEVEIACLADSSNIPMHLIPLRMNELPDDIPIVTICHHGVRSYQVALYLENAGFEQVQSLAGGVEAWASNIDTQMARY